MQSYQHVLKNSHYLSQEKLPTAISTNLRSQPYSLSQRAIAAIRREVKNDVQQDVQPSGQSIGVNVVTDARLKAVWREYLDKSKFLSGRLTDDELLQNGNHINRIIGLVQERYAISPSEAEQQMKAFLRRRYA